MPIELNSNRVAPTAGEATDSQRTGSMGENAVIRVPVGTMITNVATEEVIGDLTEHGQRLLVARGGDGGRVRVGGHVVARGGPPKRRGPRREGEGREDEQCCDYLMTTHVACSQLSARWNTVTLEREAHGMTCRWMGMW